MKHSPRTRMPAKHAAIFLSIFLVLWAAFPTQGKANGIALSHAGRLDAASPQAAQALSAARDTGMDWVVLEVDWSALPRSTDGVYNLDALSGSISKAQENGLYVALSVHNAPSWAMNADGPNPQAAAVLVQALVNAAPASIRAIELFPEPNTQAGWGAIPNPQAYAAMLHAAHTALEQNAGDVMLVTGGLALQPGLAAGSALPAPDFLSTLYRAGALPDMDVVGLSYPVFDPEKDNPEAPGGTFRRYQDIRLLMLGNGHQEGAIWITRLAWKTDAPENVQDQWLHTAYQLLRQQVYIGLVAFDGLTPPPQRPVTIVDGQGRLTTQFEMIENTISGKQTTPAASSFSWDTFVRRLKNIIHGRTIGKER